MKYHRGGNEGDGGRVQVLKTNIGHGDVGALRAKAHKTPTSQIHVKKTIQRSYWITNRYYIIESKSSL